MRSARGLALDILSAAQRQGRSVEELLAATLKRQPLLRPERAFLLELVQGVKRWELKLDYLDFPGLRHPLKKLHPMVLLILRLAAFQLLMLDRVPARAAVHEAGLEAKARRLPPAYGGFINAVLRRLAAGDLPPWPDRETDPVQALSVEYSHPAWLVRRWLERWGLEDTEARLAANNRIPPLTIRVNTLKTDPEKPPAAAGPGRGGGRSLAAFLRWACASPKSRPRRWNFLPIGKVYGFFRMRRRNWSACFCPWTRAGGCWNWAPAAAARPPTWPKS